MTASTACRAALATLGLLASACSPPPEAGHVQRGVQWLAIEEFGQARSECSQGLQLNPSSLSARQCLAFAALGAPGRPSGDIAEALEIIDQMERVRRGSPEANGIRTAAQAKLLLWFTSGNREREALELAPRLMSPAVGEAVARFVTDPTSRYFDEAVNTLAAVDQTRAGAALAQAFQSPDLGHKHRAAWRLWRMNQSQLVVEYIRTDLVARLGQANGERESRELATELVNAGYEAARPHLAALVQSGVAGTRPEAVAAAAYEAWRQRDPAGADAIAQPALVAAATGTAAFRRCGRLELAFVDGISDNEPKPVQVVRDLFGRSADDHFTSSCGRQMLQRLDAIDPADWSGVRLVYHGWTIFGTMIGGRIDDLRQRNQRSAQNNFAANRWALTRTPQMTEQLLQFMLQWGTWDAFSGGVETYVRFDGARFENPRRARLTYQVQTQWNGPPVGRIVVVVESSGNWAEQPWTIIEVVETTRL